MLRYLAPFCFAFAVTLTSAPPARAAFDCECLISVQTKRGWSKEHRARVVFVTGLELARISAALPVELPQVYVVILHEHGLPTVARLDALLPGVRQAFTERDLTRLYTAHSEPLATQIVGEGRNLKWRLRGTASSVAEDPKLALANVAAR